MANPEQLEILRQNVSIWNKWRQENPSAAIDLRQANLREAKLRGANLSRVNLENANLIGVDFSFADLREANLSNAKLVRADFTGANLANANLREAILTRANFHIAKLIEANLFGCSLYLANLDRANFSYANLEKVDFSGAYLMQTIIDHAKISGSKVYGVNVWDLEGEFEEQKDLVIIDDRGSVITVDNIEVAQFIFLILHNEKIRDVINTLTSKSVLILGRFSLPERKAILDKLRSKLREYDLLPIVFDFDRPTDRDYTETVQTLAGLSLFVIVDVTSPKSAPLEMEATVKQFKIPYVPIIDLSADPRPFAMMIDSQNSFHWVLQTFGYHTKEELLENIDAAIISRALEKYNELKVQKAGEQKILTIDDLRKSNK